MPHRISEYMPGRTQDKMSRKMIDGLPNRISENMSDKLSGRMSVAGDHLKKVMRSLAINIRELAGFQ